MGKSRTGIDRTEFPYQILAHGNGQTPPPATVATLPIIFVIALVQALAATPIYRATARLLIEPDNANVVSFREGLRDGRSLRS